MQVALPWYAERVDNQDWWGGRHYSEPRALPLLTPMCYPILSLHLKMVHDVAVITVGFDVLGAGL